MVRIEQVVFEHGKLAWVWEAVSVTVLFCQEGVNLSGGEFVRIPSLDLSNHRIIRFDALTFCLAHEVSCDDFLSHGHWPMRGVHWWQFEFSRFEGLCKREEATSLKNDLRDFIVLGGECGKFDFFTILQTLEHCMVAHELTEVDVVALMDWSE